MGASCVRWPQDTERAFLLALKATGQVIKAAAAIGPTPGVCYERRRRELASAAAWAATLDGMEHERLADAAEAGAAAGLPVVQPLTRARREGWTNQRQRSYVRALADTGSHGRAAAQIGISLTSVRRLQRRSPEFQALCDQALTDGGTTLNEAMMLRAVEGWEAPVFHAGKLAGHRRRFSDTVAIKLMEQQTGPADPRQAAVGNTASQESIDSELHKRLGALERRMKHEARAAQLA